MTRRQYKASRLDVVAGCVFTDIVAWFIIVACAATLYVHGYHNINTAEDAAQALHPLAVDYAYIPVLLWGCLNDLLYSNYHFAVIHCLHAAAAARALGLESEHWKEIQ